MREIDFVNDGNVVTLLQTILKRNTAYDRFPISYIDVRKLPYMDKPCIRMAYVDKFGIDKWIWDYQLSENDFSGGIDEFAEVLTDFWRGKIAEWSKTTEATWDSKQIQFKKYTGSVLSFRMISIVDVKFNGPATIVFWSDNTKTVVKCDPTDKFDPEKGLAMAVAKKFLGNNTGKYYDIFKKWTPTGCWMKEEKDTNAIRVSCCADCAYSDFLLTQGPCYSCRNWSNFVQKVEEKGEEKKVYSCPDCVYSNCSYSQEPCYSCRNRSHFVQKGEKKE